MAPAHIWCKSIDCQHKVAVLAEFRLQLELLIHSDRLVISRNRLLTSQGSQVQSLSCLPFQKPRQSSARQGFFVASVFPHSQPKWLNKADDNRLSGSYVAC
jgi:hypothetical protein